MNLLIDPDLKQIIEKTGYFTTLPAKVDCVDKQPDGTNCEFCLDQEWYICELCERQVPYCFGADDILFEFCGACAAKIDELSQ